MLYPLHIAIFLLCTSLNQALLPRLIGNISVEHPGFLSLSWNSTRDSPTSAWYLIISTFSGVPFSRDTLSIVPAVGNHVDQPELAPVIPISNNLLWPNEAAGIPSSVFNRSDMIIVPDGFLVPFKGAGTLTVIDLNSDLSLHRIDSSSDGQNWFFHRVLWVDMDKDGRLDALTCRAQKPIFGSSKGELLWFKQPDMEAPWMTEWKANVLASGGTAPDTFFRYETITVPGTVTKNGRAKVGPKQIDVILTAGFFSKSLDIWWRIDESKSWTADNINNAVIDNVEGPVFELIYADMNGDGSKDLLVTYNKASNGTVFIYELKNDLRLGGYAKKHMILSGINPASTGVGKGAPGAPKLLRTDSSNMKPDILLSGDDSGVLFLLTSKNTTDTSDWTYNVSKLTSAAPGTLGAIAVGDVDYDGYDEIFAPFYNDNKIAVFTFSPKSHTFP